MAYSGRKLREPEACPKDGLCPHARFVTSSATLQCSELAQTGRSQRPHAFA